MPFYEDKEGNVFEAADEATAISMAKAGVPGMGAIERFGRGALAGAGNLGRNLTAMALPAGITPEFAQPEAIRAAQDNPVLDTTAGKVGGFVGEMAAGLPLGGAVGAGARSLGALGGRVATRMAASQIPGAGVAALSGRLAQTSAPLVGATGAGAVEGAAAAGPDQRIKGAVTGGLLGGGTAVGLPWLGRKFLNPVNIDADATHLMKQGVDLTPGQMSNKTLIGGIEENLSKTPLVINAREDAYTQSIRRLLRKAAAPGSAFASMDNKTLDALTPQETAKKMLDSFSPGYNTMRQAVVDPVRTDAILKTVPGTAYNQSIFADDAMRDKLSRWIANKMTALGDSPDFGQLHDLRKQFRAEARRYQTSTPGSAESELLRGASDRITKAMETGLSPENAARLKALDRQYADAAILRDAMNRAGHRATGFTPNEVRLEMRKLNRKQHGIGAPKAGLEEDVARVQRVFNERTPPTGARMMLPAALGAGLGISALGGIDPWHIMALGIGGAASTKTGRRFAAGVTPLQQKAAAQAAALRAGMAGQMAGRLPPGALAGAVGGTSGALGQGDPESIDQLEY